MFVGAVKWFNNTKGFGLISLPGGGTLFLHLNGFRQKPDVLNSGAVVIGEKAANAKRRGKEARNCRLVGAPGDWPVLMGLLGKPDMVDVDDGGRQSLLRLGITQSCRRMSTENFVTMVTEGLQHLPPGPEAFITYASVLESAIIRGFGRDTAMQLLNRIFAAFGKRVSPDALFLVWKTRNFRYIGFPQQGDYEIPEEILGRHATELGYDELSRIQNYSFGKEFCAEVALAVLEGAETSTTEGNAGNLSAYLEFLDEPVRERMEKKLNVG